MSSLLEDLRSGFRTLIHHPGFSAVAVLTLALGVGVSSSVFSVVSGTLLNPTPWRDADRVVFVWDRNRDQANQFRPLSYPRFLDLKAQSRSFAGFAVARTFSLVLTDRETYEPVPTAFVTPESFAVLGLRIELGRSLTADDARADAPRAVVIDHATWTDRYGSDPGIVGRTIQVEREDWTVVGVLDEGSWFPFPGTALFVALRPGPTEATERNLREFFVLGRLAPDATDASVQAELALLSERLTAAYPESDPARWPLATQTVSEGTFGGPARTGVLALAGALGFLLLIACANLTSLFLTRSTARHKEIAVRAAVGASRTRIVRQLLVENAVLALVALPVALLVTRATLAFIYSRIPPQVTNVEQVVRFDAPVWLFAGGVALATVLVFGLTPALQAARLDLTRVLKEGGDRGASGSGSQRMRSTLVVAQLALSVVLLVGGLLLGQSFSKIVNAQPGFVMENLFYAPVGLPESRYAEPGQRTAFVGRLLERVAEIPGIQAVGVSDSAVSAAGGPVRRFELASRRGLPENERPEARWTAGSPGYIQALGLELIAGRHLEATDDAQGRRVALVSQSFVRALLPSGASGVGERIVLESGTEVEIVGVVQDVKQIGMNVTQRPQVYVPYAQQPSPFMQLVARTSVEPMSIGPSVRAQIDQLDPLIPVLRLTTALRERALNVWPIGLYASILALLGAVGLAMATVGVYAVVRHATQQRTREFGIRSALGAEPRSLVLLVMRQTWLLTGLGLALGLALSSALGRVLQVLLYEVDAFQPASLVLPAVLLGASSVIAGALPAARAARVDPAVVLSAE